MLKSNILGFRYIYFRVLKLVNCLQFGLLTASIVSRILLSASMVTKPTKRQKKETNNNKNGLVFFVVFVVLD